MSQGKIIKVSGPLVVADGLADANMADVVRVGKQRLIGEILNMTGDQASIQVYEETSGLGPGAEVVSTGAPLSRPLLFFPEAPGSRARTAAYFCPAAKVGKNALEPTVQDSLRRGLKGCAEGLLPSRSTKRLPAWAPERKWFPPALP